jgi:hypothetical protein
MKEGPAQFAKATFLMENSLVKMSDLIDPAITAAEGQEEIDYKYLPALPSTGSDYLKLSFFNF